MSAAKSGAQVRRSPALRGVKGKLEGVHFVKGEGFNRSGSRKRRKPTLAELESRWVAIERSFDASCEIRKRAGLPAVEPSFYAHALWDALEARRPADEVAKRRKAKPRKVAKAKPAKAPAADPAMVDLFRMFRRDLEALGTPDALAELDRRKAKRAAKRAARAAA